MKKIIISSLLIGCSLFANEIVIDKNSNVGQVILNSDKEYKEYLSKIYANKNLEDIIYKHECDINMLKDAVAKLILMMEKGKDIKVETTAVSKELNRIADENKILSESMEKKEAVKTEVTCKTIKTPIKYEKGDIKHSFINIIPDKEFKSQVKKLEVYKIPALNSEKEEVTFGFKDKFLGDKYTKAGWVHIKDTGWVKGYEIFPKVMPESVDVKYETKEICN